MKPILGWTVLSREELDQVERSLGHSEQDTRDEVGFLLIHQGFADRFFPGTSVLHTRVRYSLFVPWVYVQAANNRRRGSDLDTAIRRLLIQLAIRLKNLGGEPYDVIGGDKLGQLTSQPPDRVYWTALRKWNLMLPAIETRREALRRLVAGARATPHDDDNAPLEDDVIEVFSSLPEPPERWEDPNSRLNFKLPRNERDFLRRKLALLTRPDENAASLLARLVSANDSFDGASSTLPQELEARADAEDRRALRVARDAAALSAIGRGVYGALVEQLLAADGGPDAKIFRNLLRAHFDQYGEEAARCDLETADSFLPGLPSHVRAVLHETQDYVRANKPDKFMTLRECYQKAEVTRKSVRRARLLDTERSAQRRAEWKPERHNTTPLHYRWRIVAKMLDDLRASR